MHNVLAFEAGGKPFGSSEAIRHVEVVALLYTFPGTFEILKRGLVALRAKLSAKAIEG